MSQKPKIEKPDGRAGNGGARPGSGRKPKDPTEYKPTKKTIEKRQKAADLFDVKDAETARTVICRAADGLKHRSKPVTELQLRAANMILDRKFGRPAQEHVFVGDDDKAPIRVDSGVLASTKTEDLVQAAGAILAARRAATSRESDE